MIQFLADNIDQLDLALDQLAISDRNFDRFALMLIDNVVELTLHKYGQDKAYENKAYGHLQKTKYDTKIIEEAIGQQFDKKVKAATKLGLLDEQLKDSLLYLHQFRNTAYHQGLRHERILHSLALFYFINACDVLTAYKPQFWSWSSNDKISHRARKYIGEPNFLSTEDVFQDAYRRLKDVAESMGDRLIESLSEDIGKTIDSTDYSLDFLSKDSPEPKSRNHIVVDAQAWPVAFTDEGKEFARNNGCREENVHHYVEWIAKNYPWQIKTDPIPSWRNRKEILSKEKDKHKALKKYCDFMKQTEEIRTKIDDAAAQLDAYIQQQIDIMRGK